jgi:hypothetical protein
MGKLIDKGFYMSPDQIPQAVTFIMGARPAGEEPASPGPSAGTSQTPGGRAGSRKTRRRKQGRRRGPRG